MYTNRNILQSFKSVRIRFHSTESKGRQFKEIEIPMPWGHIAGKWWEPYNTRPILALHGWQDNCGTFDRLIPSLTTKVGVLAVDLPGHGLSSRLPPGMFYHNMNYPILIRRIVDHFKWESLSLMGHSLGAISCFTYLIMFPQNVDFLLCLDGFQPLYKKDNSPRMGVGLQEHIKYDRLARSEQEPPNYSLGEMSEMVSKANGGSIEHCHAEHILRRNIAPSQSSPGRYYFTRDPRLKSRFILNWDHRELVDAAAKATLCPVLMLKASQSGYFGDEKCFVEVFDAVKRTSSDCEYREIEGTHHVHLNHPERLADSLDRFIGKYSRG